MTVLITSAIIQGTCYVKKINKRVIE